jgi:hypothetical protein
VCNAFNILQFQNCGGTLVLRDYWLAVDDQVEIIIYAILSITAIAKSKQTAVICYP